MCVRCNRRVAALRWQWACRNIRSGRFENRRLKKHSLEDVDDTLVRAVSHASVMLWNCTMIGRSHLSVACYFGVLDALSPVHVWLHMGVNAFGFD